MVLANLWVAVNLKEPLNTLNLKIIFCIKYQLTLNFIVILNGIILEKVKVVENNRYSKEFINISLRVSGDK